MPHLQVNHSGLGTSHWNTKQRVLTYPVQPAPTACWLSIGSTGSQSPSRARRGPESHQSSAKPCVSTGGGSHDPGGFNQLQATVWHALPYHVCHDQASYSSARKPYLRWLKGRKHCAGVVSRVMSRVMTHDAERCGVQHASPAPHSSVYCCTTANHMCAHGASPTQLSLQLWQGHMLCTET